MYSCECYDYLNRHICKHVHAIHMHITQVQPRTIETDSEQQIMVTALSTKEDAHTGDDNQNKIAQLFVSVIHVHTDPRVQLSETQRLLGELSTIINEENTDVHPYLKVLTQISPRHF